MLNKTIGFMKKYGFADEPRGDYGDYIIQGVRGEIYPCKPDIFEAALLAAERGE